jgi:hypothetical protein
MQTENNTDKHPENAPFLGNGIHHPSARPMKVFVDKDGCWWLCDKPVDPDRSFETQNCWRCSDMAFTRND